jgi:adenylate kinase family enzyme
VIERLRRHERIVIAGTSSSGKTTLARALAGKLGYAHIELDALHWGPRWRPQESFRDDVTAATAGTRWIAEGNYKAVRDLLWSRATALVWLNYPFPLVLRRALWRTLVRGDSD